jgi:tRNA nucleotidyltransferase (CCA-adding enzyme)
MTITTPPEHITFVLNRLTSGGHDAFLVGGCVRDAVMGRPVHDWDLATSAAPVDVAMLFPKTVLTGEKFGTVTVVLPECNVEVTTFRTEGEYIDGRRPEQVEFISSVKEDLNRRDFTINAMAESAGGELIDPFGGLKDIEDKIIRCVGGPNTRFTEDALRMLRAFRFSAELGFTIESATLHAIYANAGMAKRISTERVRIELEKTLISQRPEIAGEMVKVGLLDRYVTSSGKSPDSLERIAELPAEPALRWCAFCAVLLDRNYINSATEFLHDMRLDGKTIKNCLRALDVAMFPNDRIGIKHLLSKHGAGVVRCAAAVNDIMNKEVSLKSTDDILTSGECFAIDELAVTGKDLLTLGHTPGRELGETLKKLLDHVIENPKNNTSEALLEIIHARHVRPECQSGLVEL